MSDNETVEALSRGLLSSEAGRRVGWATAYDARARLDQTERDLNMARADAAIYRRAASFMYGFLEQYAASLTGPDTAAILHEMIGGRLDLLDDGPMGAGRKHGADLLQAHPPDVVIAKQQARRDLSKASDRLYTNARWSAVKSLARSYGFPGPNALTMHLREVAGQPEYPRLAGRGLTGAAAIRGDNA